MGPAVLLSISTARTSIVLRLLVGIELEGRVGDAPPRARVERIRKPVCLKSPDSPRRRAMAVTGSMKNRSPTGCYC